MKPPLVVNGMGGFGDNLHQRAVLRQLMARHDVTLISPCVWPYHDLIAQGLKVAYDGSKDKLRTQRKNAQREAHLFSRATPPSRAQRMTVTYSPSDVRATGSVLGAMCKATGTDIATADFRLPVAPAWAARAQAWLDRWKPTKPLMIYRPLVDRPGDWGGCNARNPDHAAYAALFDAIRDRFFVVSVADLDPTKEWMVGLACEADVYCHKGELELETIAALMACAGLVFCSPGYAVIMAQAVGTPVACVFGGYESSRSFSAGAKFAPYLGIDPISPCECFAHKHDCRKAIDVPSALARLKEFADDASRRQIAA